MAYLFLIRQISYLLIKNLSRKQFAALILTCVIVIAFMIAMMATDRSYVMAFAMLIINADVTSIKKIVKCSFWSTLFPLLVVMTCAKLGIIIKDYILISTSGDRVAHCFGYSYYSSVSYMVLYLEIGYLFLKERNIKWIEILVLSFINYEIYQLTTTRLPFFLFCGVLILDILLIKFDWLNLNNPYLRVFVPLAFPVGCLFTYWCAKNYTPANIFWRTMNILFSSRLSLSHSAIMQYPPKLFGQYIEMQGNSIYSKGHFYFYIDSGFMYSILAYGIIFTALVVFMYSYLFWYSCKKNNKALFIWCLAVLTFTVINNTWIAITYNPMLLCFYTVLKEQKAKKFSLV
ncbi:hypothetical protein [uncultured Bacteroides sp.]|uniref:hypothetical protein n=1 Tax=uncultured Bacteroides sp. TaxID=162156 RepID=UPI002637C763|nr:hypothetical protein [uncultured Bacteroides sp.]